MQHITPRHMKFYKKMGYYSKDTLHPVLTRHKAFQTAHPSQRRASSTLHSTENTRSGVSVNALDRTILLNNRGGYHYSAVYVQTLKLRAENQLVSIICPEDILSQDELPNISDGTCFYASLLQCLFQIKPTRTWLIKNRIISIHSTVAEIGLDRTSVHAFITTLQRLGTSMNDTVPSSKTASGEI